MLDINFSSYLQNIKQNKPLVHCITNYVTVNDCANVVLAIGGSPIMADDIGEVEEITKIANCLVINIGTLNQRTVESMLLAGKTANRFNIPVVLDPVGVGASKLRTETTKKLLDTVKFSVVRGNNSELKFIAGLSAKIKGVDADENDIGDSIDNKVHFVRDLSKKLNSVVAMTGAVDVVSNGEKVYLISNGNTNMSKITGTGCMLTSLTATFVGANTDNILNATVSAVSVMGIAGELGYEYMVKNNLGTGSYRTTIIDNIYKMNEEIFERENKIKLKS